MTFYYFKWVWLGAVTLILTTGIAMTVVHEYILPWKRLAIEVSAELGQSTADACPWTKTLINQLDLTQQSDLLLIRRLATSCRVTPKK